MFELATTTPYIKYVAEFEAERAKLVKSYMAIRRCRRKLKGRINFLFENENHFLPALDNIKASEKKLAALYWGKVIADTEINIIVSEKENKRWKEIIEDTKNIPKFTEKNVISTVNQIFDSKAKFFAERISYLFEKLSKKHVTNSGFGFGEKLIIDKVHDGMSASKQYPSIDTERLGALTELRKLVAFYKSNDVLDLSNSSNITSSYDIVSKALEKLKETGKTEFFIDSGSLFIKIFKIGTIHIGIEPEIADKLNLMLAYLNGNKIAESNKSKKNKYFYDPKKYYTEKKIKPINKNVINVLKNISQMNTKHIRGEQSLRNKEFIVYFKKEETDLLNKNKLLKNEINDLLKNFGFEINSDNKLLIIEGIESYEGYKNFMKIIDNFILFGAMDDKYSYQQYYTNKELAEKAYQFMIEGETEEKIKNGSYCEPSVGNGMLAAHMPKTAKVIDLSELNCLAMKAKGYINVLNTDFIDYCIKSKELFDFILMNPPYTGRQDFNHTMSAIQKLNKDGVLVSIIPSSLKDKFDILESEGFKIEKSKDYENEFEETKIKVFMLKIKKY